MKVQKNGNVVCNIPPLEPFRTDGHTQDERICLLNFKASHWMSDNILYYNIFLNYKVKCLSVNIHSTKFTEN
jgi:hypothetical protein